jgi:alkylhydroperoxidase family enzyme
MPDDVPNPDLFTPRLRKATGPERPSYLGPADVDRVMAVLLALTSEVASLRERLDTHEQLAAAGTVADPAHVEAYEADAAVEAAREAWRDAYLRRLFRVITEDVEALKRSQP